MVVVHNMLAANANRQLGIITDEKQKSTEKLSSGYRINRAADDAAGLSISEKLRWQIRGLNRGEKNTMDGISWCQVGDGALQEIEDMVQRIRELAVQASNDTNTESDRSAIDEEVVQLRKEINRSAYNTYFNGQHVFESKEASFGVWGTPNDLQVYTSNTKTKDNTVNTDNYGGVIFDGERIPWTDINKNLVDKTTSPDDTFDAGSYSWKDDTTGRFFTLEVAEDETDIPAYTRRITMTANQNDGIIVDGEVISWADFKDEDGNAMTDANLHDGVWTFDYHGAAVAFYLTGIEDWDDVTREISQPVKDDKVYHWTVPYVGAAAEQAVDASTTSKVQVKQTMANTLDKNTLQYYVQADEKGLSLYYIDSTTKLKTTVPDSDKTWTELLNGQTSTEHPQDWADWVWGTVLASQADGSFSYVDNEGGANDTNLTVNFKISDITGMDDVIQGLNGMAITGNLVTSYNGFSYSAADNNVVGFSTSYRDSDDKLHYTKISYLDERTLGRNFEDQSGTIATATVSYEMKDGNLVANLDFAPYKYHTVANVSAPANVKMTGSFVGINSVDELKAELMDGVDDYVDYIVKEKTETALSGGNQTVSPYAYQTSVLFDVTSENGSEYVSNLTYDHSDLNDKIEVKMVMDNANGTYVKQADGSYALYDAVRDAGVTVFYGVKVTYDGKSTPDQLLKDHEKTVLEHTVGLTENATTGATVHLETSDYTYAYPSANELPNSANRSLYESVVELEEEPIGIHIQNSSNVGDYIIVSKMAMNTVVLGMFGANTKTYADSQKTIAACDNALSVLNKRRARFGSEQNRLEHTYRNSQNAEENQQSAESRIRDTDMAEEMVNNSKHDILQQAGQAMLAQANQNNQGILSLLQ